jgi:hypothetical protein
MSKEVEERKNSTIYFCKYYCRMLTILFLLSIDWLTVWWKNPLFSTSSSACVYFQHRLRQCTREWNQIIKWQTKWHVCLPLNRHILNMNENDFSSRLDAFFLLLLNILLFFFRFEYGTHRNECIIDNWCRTLERISSSYWNCIFNMIVCIYFILIHVTSSRCLEIWR